MATSFSETDLIRNETGIASDSASRIAGALAHELSNPVQGIRSMLRTLSKESEPGSALSKKLDRISSGVNRLADIIDIFHSTYAHYPRTPDRVTSHGLTQLLESAFAEQHLSVRVVSEIPDGKRFSAMAPELSSLISYVWKFRQLPSAAVTAILTSRDGEVVLTVGEGDNSGVWSLPDDAEFSTGLPILILETARMTDGNAEFQFDESGVSAVKIYLKYEV